MEFKCKYCNGTKYRQISVMVKQCEECGRQIVSEGTVCKELDFTEEKDNTIKEKVANAKFDEFFPYRIKTRIKPDGNVEYYIDDHWANLYYNARI